jgi:hypothetical protein
MHHASLNDPFTVTRHPFDKEDGSRSRTRSNISPRRRTMAKKLLPRSAEGRDVRQSTALGEILNDLQSPDGGTRAAAVRLLCPCRTAWDVPVQRYIAAMRDDPCSSVRHEVHHVLDEDSRWGKKLSARRVKEDLDADDRDADDPGRYSIGMRRRPRPRTKGASARMAWSPRGRKG